MNKENHVLLIVSAANNMFL